MRGSTIHMQANFVNGTVVIHCKDGSTESLALILPDSWITLERDIYTDGFAFKRRTPVPWRVHLPTGKETWLPAADFGKTKPDPFTVDGGAAIVLDIALDPTKEMSSISVTTKANEVVIGLISATLMN